MRGLRAGPGVTGRLTHVAAGVFFAAIFFAAFMQTDEARLLVFGGVLFVAFAAGIAIFIFGERHPLQAVAEGGDYVRGREDELAAMNRTPPTNLLTVVPDPRQLPPPPPPGAPHGA